MTESSARKRLKLTGRLGALLYLGSGVVTLITLPLPHPGMNRPATFIVGVLAVLTGSVAWFLRWERFDRRASLLLVPPALALIAAGNHYGRTDPYTFGIYFVVIFAWVGIGHRPRTSLLLALPAAAAYVFPLLQRPDPYADLASAAVTIPVSVLVGESLAWVTSRLESAEERGERLREAYEQEREAAEELRALQQRLSEAEAKYRTLVEQLPAIAYIDAIDDDSSTVYISPQVEELLGYSPQEWIEQPDLWSRLIHAEDRERVLDKHLQSNRATQGYSDEYRLVARDGREVWIQDRAILVRGDSGEPTHWQGIMLDITPRKLAEKEIADRTEELSRSLEELRRVDAVRQRLMFRLVNAQEQERARIAGDIHDDTIQKMAVVSMRLGMLSMRHPQLERDEVYEQLSDSTQQAIRRLRRLMFELHPYALERDGLAAALRLFLEQEGNQEDAPRSHLHEELESEPPGEVRTILYRLVQEAVVNVRKHARASRVDVHLSETDGGYSVVVEDDGQGFPGGNFAGSDVTHYGLVSMRERAEMAGGLLRISSTRGKGTRVEAWVPRPAEAQAEDTEAEEWAG